VSIVAEILTVLRHKSGQSLKLAASP
jgi:xanthine/CO dehydrogenase XdhC/CoxF family maturation factor